MKIPSFLLFLGLATAGTVTAQQSQPRCPSTYVRKEIRSLTNSEWSMISSVLKGMNNDGWFAWFAWIHIANFNTIHGNAIFLPFHRRMVLEFENAGRNYYNPNFFVPYWDELSDYNNPSASAVLSSKYLGGDKGSSGCVDSGLQAGWTMTYPRAHCLTRSFNAGPGKLSSWYMPEYILSIMDSSNTLSNLSNKIELSLHGIVHATIGGDMSDYTSPNDFIFMLHHANIDRLWDQWQANYGHTWTVDGTGPDGKPLTLDSSIVYYNEPVRSVMQLGYGKLCYTYNSANRATNTLSKRDTTANKKCQAKPAESVTSNIASQKAIINNILRYPELVSSRFFPNIAKNKIYADIVSEAASPAAEAVAVNKCAAKSSAVPYPTPLSDMWVNMHGFSKCSVNKVKKDANEFVDFLRQINYVPTYC
ncbi:hypothetical protein EV182_001517 [Spiromyces aspiralis]|uniref:Uncharacterized protein n=1 Tax=Spiromyces aspiralis TaxID=68401 RepID=A0ACC1HJ19_9FUNG|nr:hypothetical protein EV182_001517 [Spiromyces aspiralis]